MTYRSAPGKGQKPYSRCIDLTARLPLVSTVAMAFLDPSFLRSPWEDMPRTERTTPLKRHHEIPSYEAKARGKCIHGFLTRRSPQRVFALGTREGTAARVTSQARKDTIKLFPSLVVHG